MDTVTQHLYSTHRVRRYTCDEVAHLARLGEKMFSESVLTKLGYSCARVESSLLMFHEHSERYFQRVIVDRDDVPVGLFIAQVCNTWYAEHPIATDMVLFVDKEHRGRCGLLILEIVRQFTKWADENKAAIKTLGTALGINSDSVSRMYEHLGFERIGSIHMQTEK